MLILSHGRGEHGSAGHRFGGTPSDLVESCQTVGTYSAVGSIVQEEPDLPPSDAARLFDGHQPRRGPRTNGAGRSSSTGEEWKAPASVPRAFSVLTGGWPVDLVPSRTPA